MKTLLLSVLVASMFTGCGPSGAPIECQIDFHCGAQGRCVAGRCEQQLGVPSTSIGAGPQDPTNDTCETAQRLTVGKTLGTTRGARKNYQLQCAGGQALSSGGEVVYALTLPAQRSVKIQVDSRTPGFVPLVFITDAKPCGPTPVGGCTSLLEGTTATVQEGYLMVASSNGVDGDFEITFEARPINGNTAGGSAAGGSAGGGPAAGGSVAGGSTVSARTIWESQRDVSEITERTKDLHLGLIRDWAGVAQVAARAPSPVFSGTVTETAPGQFIYSSSPADRLEVRRLRGAQFSIAVRTLVGDLFNPLFPREDERLEFVFRHSSGSLTGSVSQSGSAQTAAGARIAWRFNGQGWTSANDSVVSTLALDYFEMRDGGSTGSTSFRWNNGSLSNTERNVTWAIKTDIWANCTICRDANGSKTTAAIETRLDARAFSIDYVYDFVSQRDAVMGRHEWSGTVRESGQTVGGFVRRLVSGTTYSLDITLGNDTYSTRTVQSLM